MAKSIVRGVLLIIIGIVAITFSVECRDMSTGKTVSHTAYGGDAYTGIQNAGADTASNVYYLSKIATYGFSSLLLVIGLTLCGFGVTEFIPDQRHKDKNTQYKQNSVRDNAMIMDQASNELPPL